MGLDEGVAPQRAIIRTAPKARIAIPKRIRSQSSRSDSCAMSRARPAHLVAVRVRRAKSFGPMTTNATIIMTRSSLQVASNIWLPHRHVIRHVAMRFYQAGTKLGNGCPSLPTHSDARRAADGIVLSH